MARRVEQKTDSPGLALVRGCPVWGRRRSAQADVVPVSPGVGADRPPRAHEVRLDTLSLARKLVLGKAALAATPPGLSASQKATRASRRPRDNLGPVLVRYREVPITMRIATVKLRVAIRDRQA
jgi:hypothetical protein